MLSRIFLCTVVLVAGIVTLAGAATIQVSQPVQVTDDSYYERGQSLVYDGSDYWLFYGRSTGANFPYSGGDPDTHDYAVYYKKAAGIVGLASATATTFTATHNANSYMGETGAAYYGGDVWTFATIDIGTNAELYGWWTDDGGTTWNEVGPIVSGLSDGQAHHDEIVFGGELWVLEGSGDYNTRHSATPKTPASFSTPLQVPGGLTGGLGHFFIDGSDLYLALGSGGTYYIYQYDDGDVEWDLIDSKAISGYYDPTLYKIGTDYVFHCAPYSGGRQWIVGWAGSTLDGNFFDGDEHAVIEGQYGSNVWVDMWPIGFTDAGNNSYLFYSSERNASDPSAEIAGNICFVAVDWDLAQDHYVAIQEAIDGASAGDQIDIAAGTYTENIDVDKQLEIVGAGSGSDPAANTILTQTPAGAGDTKVGVVQLTGTGASGTPILLQDLRLEPSGMAGISVGRFTEGTATTVSYVTLDNVHVIGTNVNPSTEQERGLYVDKTSSLFHLDVDDCAFDNLTYGWYFQKEVSTDASTVQYVTVDNTTFNHNNHKGLYAEKLSDATFTECTADDNGFDSSVLPSYFAPWSCGLDVNLKAGTYANLAFIDCIVTDNAIDESQEGVGLTVKARDDGATYGPYPASVDNVDVIGCTVTGNERGLRFGEPGKDNASPTHVTVEDCTLTGNVQHYSGTDGSAYGDLINMTASAVIDASPNWWGDTDPSDQAHGDAVLYPCYADAGMTTLYYPPVHNVTQDTYYVTIQDAIDDAVAGDEIEIDPGTYEEQLHIATADLTLTGAGSGDNPAVDTIILSPTALTWYYTTSTDNYPIVGIDGVTGVEIASLRVDGDGRGNSNYRFQGIGFWNAGGDVTDVDVVNVMDTPFSGSQHGVGIYAYNTTGGPYTVNLTGVDVVDYQKGAIALNGAGLTANVVNCTTTGAGATTVTAQNGIQMYGGNGGTISGCEVSGNMYTGSGWAASGILLIEAGSVTITDTDVNDSDPCVYCQDTSADADEMTITNSDIDSGNGFYTRVDTGIPTAPRDEMQAPLEPSPFGDGPIGPRDNRGTATVSITNSTFIGQTTGYGVAASNYVATDLIDLTVTDCTVKNWGWGFVMFGSGGEIASHISGNGIFDNDGFFYADEALTTTQDASGNYWGSTDPETLAGDAIYGDIDYSPWLGGGVENAPGYTADFSELWVDDDSPQIGTGGVIQEGIDLVSGSTVNVAAGTYTPAITINIPTSNLALIGAGRDLTFVKSTTASPLITVAADNVTIQDLELTDDAYLVEGVRLATGASAGLDVTNVDLTNLGNTGGGNAYGINVPLSFDGLTVSNCDFVAMAHTAYLRSIGIFSSNHWNLSNFTIEDCDFTHIWTCIYLRSAIDGLDVTGNTFGPFLLCDGAACSAGIYIGDGDDDNFDIENVTVTGNTFTDYNRGVYVWEYGANSTIADFTISDNDFINAIYSSAIRFIIGLDAIESYALDGLVIDGNTFTQNSDVGANVALVDLRTYDATLTTCDVAITDNEMTFTGGPYVDAMYGVTFLAGGSPFAGSTVVSGNVIDGGGTGGAGTPPSSGISIKHYSDDYTWPTALDVEFTGNVITGFDAGVSIYDMVDTVYGGLPTGSAVDVHYNSISGNTYGAQSGAGEAIDALTNWWGDASGPYNATSNPTGTGDEVTDYVDFDPWTGKTGGENLVADPDPLIINTDDYTGSAYVDGLVATYLGGGSAGLYGYSIDVEWDVSKATATTSDFTRPATGAFATAVLFQVTDQSGGSGGHVRIDAALGGAHPGVFGETDLFAATFTGAGCGDSDVTLTINHVRDNQNQPISGIYDDDGLLQVDMNDPSVTNEALVRTNLPDTGYAKDGDDLVITANFDDGCAGTGGLTITADLSGLLEGGGTAVAPTSLVGTLATWSLPAVDLTTPDESKSVTLAAEDPLGNSVSTSVSVYADNTLPAATVTGLTAFPGHNKVDLSWTNPVGGDPNLDAYGVMLRRVPWGDYPTYTPPAPDYPDSTEGERAYWAAGMATAYTDTGFDGNGQERDIYYYSAFVFDAAYNYSISNSGAQDGATNYWLGDVAPYPNPLGDGYVATSDISALSDTYGHTPTSPNWNPHCDIGPTSNSGGYGIPMPDGIIGFEDLMIFALNFGVVGPTDQLPAIFEVTSPSLGNVALSLDVAGGDEIILRVLLKDDDALAQGARFLIDYDHSVCEFLSAGPGEVTSGCEQLFFRTLPGEEPEINLASLGAESALGGTGELVVLRFRRIGEGDLHFALVEPALRDSQNRNLLDSFADVTIDELAGDLEVPKHVFLNSAYPNPVARQTAITFGLPKNAPVRVAIFDVSGRLVRTLAEGLYAAGEHNVTWDRTTDNGARAGANVYFYRLETPARTITHRLVVTN